MTLVRVDDVDLPPTTPPAMAPALIDFRDQGVKDEEDPLNDVVAGLFVNGKEVVLNVGGGVLEAIVVSVEEEREVLTVVLVAVCVIDDTTLQRST